MRRMDRHDAVGDERGAAAALALLRASPRRQRRRQRARRAGDGRAAAASTGRADAADARRRRGPAQHPRLAGLRRGRLDRHDGRLGHAVREGDRLQGQRQDRRHVRRDVRADEDRPVRRRLGVRRRVAAADRRRRRRAGQHRPRAELRRRLRRPEEQAVEHGQRRRLRHPARPRREHADVQHGHREAGADVVERGLRRELAVQGQGHRVRLADLHRRRGALPDEDQARPQDQEPVRARRRRSSTRRSTCSRQQKPRSASTGRTPQSRSRRSRRGDTVLGTTWQSSGNLLRRDKAPVEAILPTEGSTGWSDTWMVGAKAKHKNCAYRWLDHIISPDGERRRSPSGSARRRRTRSRAPMTDATRPSATPSTPTTRRTSTKVWYWTTPIEQCLDGRTDVTCMDYADWTQAWPEIKG